MVLLLNLVVAAIGITGILLTLKFRKPWIAVLTLALIIGYSFIQPSYMPKGEIKRSEIPLFEQKGAIEDRNSKPKAGGQYDSEREETVKEGLQFK